MLLGLTRPDRGSVSLLDRPPTQAVADGLVAAMLQAGALIRDVTPRELLTLMASLHPSSLGVRETLELTGLSEIADRLVAAMLQAGALIRDVTPRELLTLMASLHPNSLGVQETLELTGLGEIADRRTHKL